MGKIVVSRQSLPALASIILGMLMMAMPFIVKHNGYVGEVMMASDKMKPPFDQTLILIGQESLAGSVGIILNKPLSDSQHEKLSPFIRDSGIPVGYGGPLEVSEKIFVVEETGQDPVTHEPDIDIETWDEAVHSTPDLLDKIRLSLKKGEQRYRVFTGYAGWSTFQLAEEVLLKNQWHALSVTHDMLFQNTPATQWGVLNLKQKAKESHANQI